MATNKSFADYVVDQISSVGHVEAKKMFGEYAIYCDSKIVALVCDNQLFIKPTAAGRTFIGTPTEAPPYPGAKPHFLIDSKLDDQEWISHLVRLSFNELPAPKPKNKKPV